MIFNQERILVTSPKALAEVLVTKNYDFVKPGLFRQGLARILGVGILLAEGEEHKFQRKNLLPAFAFRQIKALYPIFWTKCSLLVKTLTEEIKSKAAAEAANETGHGEKTPLLVQALSLMVSHGFLVALST